MPDRSRKGQILNGISAYWFDFVKDIIPNHVITTKFEVPGGVSARRTAEEACLFKKLKMLPVECIVRGYITGSGWG